MNEERIELLLQYLNNLKGLSEEGYFCKNEIKEVIDGLRKEFGFNQQTVHEFEIFEDGTLHIQRQPHKMSASYNDNYEGPIKVIIVKSES